MKFTTLVATCIWAAMGMCSAGAAAAQNINKPIHLVAKRVVAPSPASSAGATVATNRSALLTTDAMAIASMRAWMVNRRLPVHLRTLKAGEQVRREVLPKIPVVTAVPLASANDSFTAFPEPNGFLGSLGSYESEQINGAQPIEPPDQGLCTDGSTVFEMVNLVISKYDANGNRQPGFPQPLNLFFASGSDFISDPKCYFDASTNTFFFSITDLTSGPAKSTTQSFLLIASMSAAGIAPAVYAIPTDDTGNHPKCPCFEDQPLLGADANAVFLLGNEFPLNPFSTKFYGAQIYAVNKADLVARGPSVGVTVFPNFPNLYAEAEGVAASIQPAIATDGIFVPDNGGTEYLMNTLDFVGKRDDRIGLWAITGTCGIPHFDLSTDCASVPTLLTPAIVATDAYGVPPSAKQENGFIPVGKACGNGKQKLDTGDDRMQQVTLAGGNLYSAVTTVLKTGQPVAKHAGIYYFEVTPSVTGGTTVGGAIVRPGTGYLAAEKLDVYYPSIAVTQGGSALMTFSMSGKQMFPSSAYAPLTNDLGILNIHTAVPGVGTYDGFSGYRKCGGIPPSRWGDYSAAIATGTTMWIASEYVSGTCDFATWAIDGTCGGVRGLFENWGTFVGNVVPPGGP